MTSDIFDFIDDEEFYTTDRDVLLQDPRYDDFPYAIPPLKHDLPDDEEGPGLDPDAPMD